MVSEIRIVHAFVEGEEGDLVAGLEARIEELEQRLNAWWDGNSACLARIEELKQERDEITDESLEFQRLLREAQACLAQAQKAGVENSHIHARVLERLAQAERERDEAQEAFRDTSDHADAVSAQLEQAQDEFQEYREHFAKMMDAKDKAQRERDEWKELELDSRGRVMKLEQRLAQAEKVVGAAKAVPFPDHENVPEWMFDLGCALAEWEGK